MSAVGSTFRLVRRHWRAWVSCLGLGVAAGLIHIGHGMNLRHESEVTGWVLVVLMVLLTAYNVRKKLDFLRAWFTSRTWLEDHLVLGYLSLGVFFVHAGAGLPTGYLETLLWLAYLVVAVSGIFGHYISRRFPRLLADRGQEVIYERVPEFIREQRLRVEAAVLDAVSGTEDSTSIPEFYERRLAGFFTGPKNAWSHLRESRRPLTDLLEGVDALAPFAAIEDKTSLETIRSSIRIKDDLDYHFAHQRLLKYWLFVHVPLAYCVLLLTVVHVILAYAFGGIP